MYERFRDIDIINGLPILFCNNVLATLDIDILYAFDKLNIKSLEDLFNAYDKGYFDYPLDDLRKKIHLELKGQTELLMAYYMGTPLIADEVLEKNISLGENDDEVCWFDEENIYKLISIGLTEAEITLLHHYCESKLKQYRAGKKDPFCSELFQRGNANIIDIMEAFVSDRKYQTTEIINSSVPKGIMKDIQNIIFKLCFYKKYIQSNKKEHEEFNPSLALDALREQQEFLNQTEKKLDYKINTLERKLADLRYKKTAINSQYELIRKQRSSIKYH